MNWLFIVVMLIMLFMIIHGFSRGLLRILFSLIAVILLIGVTGYAAPHINTFLKENTQIHTEIAERWTERLSDSSDQAIGSAAQEQQQSLDSAGIQLPDTLEQYVFGGGVNHAQDMVNHSGVYQVAGEHMADIIVSVTAFLIALIAAVIVVWLIGKATDLINKIPVIGGINRFLGIFAGMIEGFIIVWILFAFTALISGSVLGQTMLTCINENPFLYGLYEHNPILNILTGLLGK